MPLAAMPRCFLDRLCISREISVEDWIDRSASLDLDGLEFYWDFVADASPGQLESYRKRVDAQGRSIPMMCFAPDYTRPDLTGRRQEMAKQVRAIEATALLGGQFCRVLSGQRRPLVTRDQGLTWAAECIREMIPVAEEHDVILILENHYKDAYWSRPEFAQSTEMFLELIERVGRHTHFGVNFDPSNAIITGEDPIALLEEVKDRVVTMHASDRFLEGGTLEDLRRHDLHPELGYAPILRHGIIGRGLNDYDRIFSILKQAGFQGWISIEDGEDPEVGMEHLTESAAFLRGKMSHWGLS